MLAKAAVATREPEEAAVDNRHNPKTKEAEKVAVETLEPEEAAVEYPKWFGGTDQCLTGDGPPRDWVMCASIGDGPGRTFRSGQFGSWYVVPVSEILRRSDPIQPAPKAPEQSSGTVRMIRKQHARPSGPGTEAAPSAKALLGAEIVATLQQIAPGSSLANGSFAIRMAKHGPKALGSEQDQRFKRAIWALQCMYTRWVLLARMVEDTDDAWMVEWERTEVKIIGKTMVEDKDDARYWLDIHRGDRGFPSDPWGFEHDRNGWSLA